MIYRHRFRVRAPLAAVAEFHRRSANMAAITPPPVTVRMAAAPAILAEGDEMAFTLGVGPLRVDWRARIEDVGPAGFTDRQIAGPFERWAHRHGFEASDAGSTEVVDTIDLSLRRHWLWGPFGALMVAGLPVLFAFRARRTRGLLQTE